MLVGMEADVICNKYIVLLSEMSADDKIEDVDLQTNPVELRMDIKFQVKLEMLLTYFTCGVILHLTGGGYAGERCRSL